MSELEFSTDRTRLEREMIWQFLSERSYWVKGTTRERVNRSIDNSFCVGAYVDGKQVAFARAVTDFVRFAYVMDVFVLEVHRGKGYGKQIMQYLLKHPDVADVDKWMLGTLDAHGLYKQFGFAPLPQPERMMGLNTKK